MQKSPIEQLRDGELPKMVRWYDPRLLARVGVRTMVSTVFGQYADQRLIQAATDPAVGRQLIERYDYGDTDSGDPHQCVAVDGDGAFWLDYICDIGDGFDATYATAYLLAQDKLVLKAGTALPHGDILIMGGDQCYPQATRPEYKKRLQNVYNIALSGNEPKRKLFAIPGNHDWYDGLQAFDSLFCSSRDKLSERKGNIIGGWQCQQHRSYWALKLPHKWWVWGTDIQFSKYLDIAQVNYFAAVAAEMGPEDKLIICMAEPAWMLADFQGQDEEENFFKITAIARERGVRVCAVLAGDWHHYARYSSAELGVHFFTAGGGGSFLHPTHVLKNEIPVRWPEVETTYHGNDEHGTITREMTAHRYDVRLKRPEKTGGSPKAGKSDAADAIAEVRQDIKDTLREVARKAEEKLKPRAPKCYPSRSTSLLLSLRNVAFPLFNFPFAMGIGLIYWLITWQFHTVVRAYDISSGKVDQAGLTIAPEALLSWMPLYILQATLSMSFAVMLLGLYIALVAYVDAEEKPGFWRYFTKFTVGTAHFLVHVTAMFALFILFLSANNNIAPWVTEQANAVLARAAPDAGMVSSIAKEALEPLSRERQSRRELRDVGPRDPVPPTPPAAKDTAAAKTIDAKTVRELVGLFYPFEMTLIGGLIGGLIWGCYWVVAGMFGHMHAEDAFAALRIKHFRNFLRIKFEPDQVTIYPIGLDHVPGSRDWVETDGTVYASGGKSGLSPRRPLRPHLIEDPIVIRPENVKS